MSARAPAGHEAERTIMDLARIQHGVVTRSQLLAAGVTAAQMDRRLFGHRLHALHRGVYLAGPLLGPLTLEMGAILACGESAVVSLQSSAALWQVLLDGRDAGAIGAAGVRAPTGAAGIRAPVSAAGVRAPTGAAGIRAPVSAAGVGAPTGASATRVHARRPTSSHAATINGGSSPHPSTGLREVDVTIPPDSRRYRPGIRIHRMALRDDEVTTFDMIPVTTPARTLYDLAGILPERDLERALAEALARRLTTRDQLETLATRYRRRAGVGRLRALLGSDQQPALTRSAAEEHFLAMIRRAQLPAWEVNVDVRGHEVDFFWRTERLAVEIDGFAFHSSRRRFESDRRRDADLAAAGVRVMRITWRQIENEPEALLVRLALALGQTGRRSI